MTCMLILLIITFLVSKKKVANRISQIYWKANRLKGGQRDEKQKTKQPTIKEKIKRTKKTKQAKKTNKTKQKGQKGQKDQKAKRAKKIKRPKDPKRPKRPKGPKKAKITK